MADRPDRGPQALPDRMQPGRSVLGRVVRQAERLIRIERALQQLLPENLRGHVTVAGLDTGHLSLLASSSARATQLRFQQRLIQTQLAELTGEPVQHISVAVRSRAIDSPKSTPLEPIGIPAAAAAHFAEMAREESDPELRKALERLARRTH
ncbi:MAG: DUF721 domain-containing protein [Gammaproteobacteria bacterium]|nr:DUF721 domain-containing protein [Gammaproteobacteria bacterium]